MTPKATILLNDPRFDDLFSTDKSLLLSKKTYLIGDTNALLFLADTNQSCFSELLKDTLVIIVEEVLLEIFENGFTQRDNLIGLLSYFKEKTGMILLVENEKILKNYIGQTDTMTTTEKRSVLFKEHYKKNFTAALLSNVNPKGQGSLDVIIQKFDELTKNRGEIYISAFVLTMSNIYPKCQNHIVFSDDKGMFRLLQGIDFIHPESSISIQSSLRFLSDLYLDGAACYRADIERYFSKYTERKIMYYKIMNGIKYDTLLENKCPFIKYMTELESKKISVLF